MGALDIIAAIGLVLAIGVLLYAALSGKAGEGE